MRKCVWLLLGFGKILQAETGWQAWLRYAAVKGAVLERYRETVPAVVTMLSESALIENARNELVRGVREMIGRTMREASELPKEDSIVLGTEEAVRRSLPDWQAGTAPRLDGYRLQTIRSGGFRYTVVTAANDRGVLYGAFALLRKIGLGERVDNLDDHQFSRTSVRWGQSVG